MPAPRATPTATAGPTHRSSARARIRAASSRAIWLRGPSTRSSGLGSRSSIRAPRWRACSFASRPRARPSAACASTFPRRDASRIDAPALAALTSAPFATVVESDQLVVVDRTMSWSDTGYGSHAASAIVSPSSTWYLAEGSTSGDFVLFYLLQNPNDSAVNATVRFLRPRPLAPIDVDVFTAGPVAHHGSRGYRCSGARQHGCLRRRHCQSADHRRAGDVSRPPRPAVRSRTRKRGRHRPGERMVPRGRGDGDVLRVVSADCQSEPRRRSPRRRLSAPDGNVLTKAYTVAGESRFTIWVDEEQFPAGSGNKALAGTAVSMRVRTTNGVPVIVERSMWWPQPIWNEGHNEAGTTVTGTRWALAEGEVGGPASVQTFVLVANTSAVPGVAQVTLYFEDGTTAVRTVALPPSSRTNVPVADLFPQAADRRPSPSRCKACRDAGSSVAPADRRRAGDVLEPGRCRVGGGHGGAGDPTPPVSTRDAEKARRG